MLIGLSHIFAVSLGPASFLDSQGAVLPNGASLIVFMDDRDENGSDVSTGCWFRISMKVGTVGASQRLRGRGPRPLPVCLRIIGMAESALDIPASGIRLVDVYQTA